MSGASIVEGLFKKVTKDADGFENVDEFWETANVLKYPMIKPIESYLNKCSEEYMKALTGNKFATETDPGSSTDDDFDYEDDNKSFTDASDEDSLVSDDETAQVDVSIALTPESKKGRGSVSTAGSKGTLNESLPLEDTMNTTVNSESRRMSRSQYSADESNNNVSILTSVTTPGGKGGKTSTGGAKERGRSSVGLNDSGTTAQPNSSQDEVDLSPSVNTTAASARSGRSGKSSRQSDSEGSNTLATPVSKTTRGSRSAPNTMDTNLSAPFSAAQQGGRTPGSNRRVSFGNLSPIGRDSSAGKKGSRRSTLGSINDPSTDVSTGAAGSGGGEDAYDAYDNNDGDMYFDEEEPDERMVSMESSVHTPQSNKSHSRGNNSTTTTPASSASSASSKGNSSRRAPRTPQSVMHLSQIDTPKTGELYRGITLPDESYVQDDEDTDREEDASRLNTSRDSTNTSFALDESSFMDNSFLYTISEKNPNYFGNKDEAKEVVAKKSYAISSKKRKVYTSDEEDAANDLGINSDDSDDDGGKRRSKRATKGQKFAFWKGERPIYEHGTLVGINAAAKTPVKPKSNKKFSRGGGNTKSSKNKLLKDVEGEASDNEEQEEEEKVKPKPVESKIVLPKNLTYVKRDSFNTILTWNDEAQDVVDEQVVRRSEELSPHELKPSRRRSGAKTVNCLAVQALAHNQLADGSMSGWISGHVILPPRGIKDEEQVGRFNMIFALAECQDGAVELAIANPESNDWDADTAQRLLLKKGDTFTIPPANIYRLENHSTTIPATLYFTIIKCIEDTASVRAAHAQPEAVY